MKITIGEYDEKTRQVPVTFEHADVTFTRTVNACHNEAGEYDADATVERAGEVARGVEVKIDMGIITNPPPPEGNDEDEEETEA